MPENFEVSVNWCVLWSEFVHDTGAVSGSTICWSERPRLPPITSVSGRFASASYAEFLDAADRCAQ